MKSGDTRFMLDSNDMQRSVGSQVRVMSQRYPISLSNTGPVSLFHYPIIIKAKSPSNILKKTLCAQSQKRRFASAAQAMYCL